MNVPNDNIILHYLLHGHVDFFLIPVDYSWYGRHD